MIERDAILTHLMLNGLVTDDQHGFLPGRDWTLALETNKALDVIYTDFSKAFDSVAHNPLILKLKSMGIVGDLLSWIVFPDRKISVC